MSRSTFHRFAWATLAYNIFVIVWGAFVRATGSGAGCGSNWPTCNGEVVPRSPGIETMIEYFHRTTSGLALILVVVMVVLARRLYGAGHRVRKAAYATLVLILIEAGIGASLVLLELVADNSSMARAFYMAVHLANTFLLLGALTLTAHFASERAPELGRLRGTEPARWLWYSVGAMLIVGVSGAIAALGDTLFPAESLIEGLRQDLSPTSHLLIQLRVFHPFLAFGGSIVLLTFVGAVRRATKKVETEAAAEAKKNATRLNILVLVQLAAGGINIVLLAPVWMQLVHLLLADLMWIALILAGAYCLAAETVTEGQGAADGKARPRGTALASEATGDPEAADPSVVRA